MQRHKGVETMTDETIKQILKFRDERNWKQFHNPKDLAISISLEAAELLEVFQWSGGDVEDLAEYLMVEIQRGGGRGRATEAD